MAYPGRAELRRGVHRKRWGASPHPFNKAGLTESVEKVMDENGVSMLPRGSIHLLRDTEHGRECLCGCDRAMAVYPEELNQFAPRKRSARPASDCTNVERHKTHDPAALR